MGWGPDLQDEIPDTGKPEARWHGCGEHQEACLKVLPDQDRALPVRTVPPLDEEPGTPQCWWCRYRSQAREHLFEVCLEWKAQQKILWVEVRKETGRWKDRWRIRDLLADERCSRAVLDFLTSTDVGRRVPAAEDTVSELSEQELREWEEEQGAEAEELGVGELPLFLPTPDFMVSAGGE